MQVGPNGAQTPGCIKNLNAVVLAIRHVQQIVIAEGDDVRRVKVARRSSSLTPLEHVVTTGVEFYDARIPVAICHEKITRRRDAHVSGLKKVGRVATGDTVSAQGQDEFARGTKLHHEMAADIGNPDIVPRVDVQAVQPVTRGDRNGCRSAQIVRDGAAQDLTLELGAGWRQADHRAVLHRR